MRRKIDERVQCDYGVDEVLWVQRRWMWREVSEERQTSGEEVS